MMHALVIAPFETLGFMRTALSAAAGVAGGGVDASAVGVAAADDGVGPADGKNESAHGADEPEAGPPGEKEGDAEHIETAGVPIAKEQAGGL